MSIDKDKLDKMRREADAVLAKLGEDMTEMTQMTSAMHELFLGLQQGGFTHQESLWIMGYIFSAGAHNLGEESGPT